MLILFFLSALLALQPGTPTTKPTEPDSSVSLALPAGTASPFSPAFKSGDKRLVKIRGSVVKTGDKEKRTQPKSTDAIVHILESHTDYWIIEITLMVPDDPELTKETLDALKKQIEAFGTPMKVRLNSNGSMTLINLKEIQAAALKSGRLALEQDAKARGQEISEARIKQVLGIIESQFEDPAKASAMILKDYFVMFAHVGSTVERGKTVKDQTELQGVLSTSTVKASRSTRVESVTANDRFRALTVKSKIDPGGMKDLVREFIKTHLPKNAGEPSAAEIEATKIDVRQELSLNFDTSSGWPTRLNTLTMIETRFASKEESTWDHTDYMFGEVSEIAPK